MAVPPSPVAWRASGRQTSKCTCSRRARPEATRSPRSRRAAAGGGDLQRDLANADMIFIVACRGDDVGLVPVVSSIAHSRKHPVTALYIVAADAFASGGEDATLKTLRAGVEVLVVVTDESYVMAMIAALGG
jgi:hypothetical protein